MSTEKAVDDLQYKGTRQQRDKADPNTRYKQFEVHHLSGKKLTLTDIEDEMRKKTKEIILEKGVSLYKCQCKPPKYLMQIRNHDVLEKLVLNGLTEIHNLDVAKKLASNGLPKWYSLNKL